ncbi:ATPase [Ilumatobacter sp.]|uniref:ATP-dependent sacrificial sulfur transferase LarE n=1 Tax=Ilumatobacter sp. TaxID=1967498 RepID=UPI003C4E5015
MQVSITARPDASAALDRLGAVLSGIDRRVVACSGGIDSLVLSTVAHRADSAATTVAHTVTPAVPGDGTARVVAYAEREGWDLRLVRSGEFDDESYLENPVDRCYHCKRNLYDAVDELARSSSVTAAVVLSGANLDDLGEYRPGLVAAAEHSVRHPYIEAQLTKSDVRAVARHLGLPDAELPASPCLASRLYTGTRVTPSRLRAIEAGELLVRDRTGIGVVRCRVNETTVLIEVADEDRPYLTDEVLADVTRVMVEVEPSIATVDLDDRAYEPGRAFVGAAGSPAS